MNSFTTFNYLSHSIRVVQISGRPWFSVKDTCEALNVYQRVTKGRPETNTSHVKLVLLDDEYQLLTPSQVGGAGNKGKGMAIISESGLYKLIMRSDKPEARKFQDWVTREVLPAIRKDGGYILGEERVRRR